MVGRNGRKIQYFRREDEEEKEIKDIHAGRRRREKINKKETKIIRILWKRMRKIIS